MIAKDKQWRSASYLKYIRSFPCCWCGSDENIQSHHLRGFGLDGGTGLKPSDCYTIPLCPICHAEVHKNQYIIDQPRALSLTLGNAIKSGRLVFK